MVLTDHCTTRCMSKRCSATRVTKRETKEEILILMRQVKIAFSKVVNFSE